jgi:hypothetical protein
MALTFDKAINLFRSFPELKEKRVNQIRQALYLRKAEQKENSY